jgi:hypothetical protein
MTPASEPKAVRQPDPAIVEVINRRKTEVVDKIAKLQAQRAGIDAEIKECEQSVAHYNYLLTLDNLNPQDFLNRQDQ